MLGALASIIADKVIMAHANNIASYEKELSNIINNTAYDDQDDLRRAELVRLIAIERDALIAQTKLMAK